MFMWNHEKCSTGPILECETKELLMYIFHSESMLKKSGFHPITKGRKYKRPKLSRVISCLPFPLKQIVTLGKRRQIAPRNNVIWI